MEEFQVLFISAHPLLSNALRQICAEEGIQITFKTCATLQEIEESIAASEVDLVCLSSQEFDADKSLLLQKVQNISPHLRVIIIAQGNESASLEMVKNGAEDCIALTDLPRLAAAFHRVRRKKAERNKLLHRMQEVEKNKKDVQQNFQQFTSIASHDLQEPLRVVSQYLLLIRRRYKDELNEEAQEFLEMTIAASERMNNMLQDLLKFSRLVTRARPWTDVDLQVAMEGAMAFLHELIEETEAEFDIDPLPVVHGEPKHLRDLLYQLLKNSLKFRGEDKPVVQVTVEERENEYAFAVKDNGIGIPDDMKDNIFLPFQRINPWGPRSGTGMGLAICKKIVEQHGGRIGLESKVEEGSIFFFTLPKRQG